MKPLLDEQEYAEVLAEAEHFNKSEGVKLQRALWVKYWMSTNYIADWWENYVYLQSRPSLMINSNYYVMDRWVLLIDCTSNRLLIYTLLHTLLHTLIYPLIHPPTHITHGQPRRSSHHNSGRTGCRDDPPDPAV
jgi:hypothetical protein